MDTLLRIIQKTHCLRLLICGVDMLGAYHTNMWMISGNICVEYTF